MKRPAINSKYFFLLIIVSVFLFIFPWTKEVKVYRTEDITWDILKSALKTNQFDIHSFSFQRNYRLNENITELNGQKISITGFFKKEKHSGHTDYILTESVTNVCFACDHDEHYNFIELFPNSDEIHIFDTLKNDRMIKVSGDFEISNNKHSHSVFLLRNAYLTEEIN